MIVSVVIPTYGRSEKLLATLDALLKSETNDLTQLEIIVVDDGSPISVASAVHSRVAKSPFTVRCIRQENAGPAAARNRGFREATGEIVLFLDDDILCPPNLIVDHVAAHRQFPGSVIFGRCPFAQEERTPLLDYVQSLGGDAAQNSPDEFMHVDIVASGQISVERSMFDDDSAVYRDDLATPAAEEYELSWRLQQRNIPLLLGTRLVARHDHLVEIGNMCRQAYKHAYGCAEASAKCPGTLSLPDVERIIQHGRHVSRRAGIRTRVQQAAKTLASRRPVRATTLRAVKILEPVARHTSTLVPIYRTLLGMHHYAGLYDGLARYTNDKVAADNAKCDGTSRKSNVPCV